MYLFMVESIISTLFEFFFPNTTKIFIFYYYVFMVKISFLLLFEFFPQIQQKYAFFIMYLW